MNSKLRDIPEHIKTVRDAVRWSYNHGFLKGEFPNKTAVDKKLVLDTAEKAIRQAVGEEMLELVGDNEYGNIGYDGEEMVDETTEEMLYRNQLRAELRQKIKQWVALKETTK